MISTQSRRILDQAGIDVVRAAYTKAMTVRVLPRDYLDTVQFSGGQVSLGEVDEWLQRYSQIQSAQARRAYVRSNLSLAIAIVSLIVAALVAILK
jgi:hypothetical protein